MTIRTLALLHVLLMCACLALLAWTESLVRGHAWPETEGQLVRAPMAFALMLLMFSGAGILAEWGLGRSRLRLGGDMPPTTLNHR